MEKREKTHKVIGRYKDNGKRITVLEPGYPNMDQECEYTVQPKSGKILHSTSPLRRKSYEAGRKIIGLNYD